MVTNKFVYFLYSEEQVKERNEILAKQGKVFVPGTVYVGMSRISFSQLSEKDTIDRFIDTKVVAKGYKNQMKFDMPKTKKKESD
jgi:hypothetical protein